MTEQINIGIRHRNIFAWISEHRTSAVWPESAELYSLWMKFQLTNWLKDLLSPKLLTTCQVDISRYFNAHVLLSNFATAAANTIFWSLLNQPCFMGLFWKANHWDFCSSFYTWDAVTVIKSTVSKHRRMQQSIYNYKMSSAPACSPYTTSCRHAENLVSIRGCSPKFYDIKIQDLTRRKNWLGSLVFEIIKEEDTEEWLTVVWLPGLFTSTVSHTQTRQRIIQWTYWQAWVSE